MASNGENGVKHTYALTETHKEVSCYSSMASANTDSPTQMLEKSLVETDPEIAEIMVCPPYNSDAIPSSDGDI
jgi:glycine hydroxymethyltransferase